MSALPYQPARGRATAPSYKPSVDPDREQHVETAEARPQRSSGSLRYPLSLSRGAVGSSGALAIPYAATARM
jgi:hypothetical protein